MNKEKLMGLILGVIGIVLLVGGLYMVMNYLGALLNVMIEFVTANSRTISECGVTIPNQLMGLKDQVATTILPMIYLGIPVSVVILACIMFAGGFFYGKGSFKDEIHKEMRQEEEVEREVEKRVSRRKKKEDEPEEEEEEA